MICLIVEVIGTIFLPIPVEVFVIVRRISVVVVICARASIMVSSTGIRSSGMGVYDHYAPKDQHEYQQDQFRPPPAF